jgi:hypothetical protein
MRYTILKTVEYIQVIEAASADAAEEIARNDPDNWEHLSTEIFADDEPVEEDDEAPRPAARFDYKEGSND